MTAGRKCKVASILLSTVANPKTGFVTCIPTGTLPTLGPNACTWQQVFFTSLQSQLSTRSLRQMLCGSQIKVMFFVSFFFSFDSQDFKF